MFNLIPGFQKLSQVVHLIRHNYEPNYNNNPPVLKPNPHLLERLLRAALLFRLFFK